MAKYDFNVPLLNELNEPVTRVVYDRAQAKPDSNGNLTAPAKLNEDGTIMTENVTVADSLITALNHVFEGDEKLTYEERAGRGKLIRKLADKTKSSLKNYTPEQLVVIKTIIAKAGATPLLLDQLDSIINPAPETEEQAA